MKYFLSVFSFFLLFSLRLYATEPVPYTTPDGKQYELYIGNDQFAIDFNAGMQALKANEGVLYLPAKHAYTELDIPFLKTPFAKESIVGNIGLYYRIDTELTVEILAYEEYEALNNCCVVPEVHFDEETPKASNEDENNDRNLYLGYWDNPDDNVTVDIIHNERIGYKRWPVGNNKREPLIIDINEEIDILSLTTVGNRTSRCSYYFKITEYANDAIIIREENSDGTDRRTDKPLYYSENNIAFQAPGLFYVYAEVKFSRGAKLDPCSGKKSTRWVSGWLCVKYPPITLYKPSDLTVEEYNCGSTRVSTTVANHSYMEETAIAYYFQNIGNPTITFPAQTGTVGSGYSLTGSISLSGTYRVVSVNVCSNEKSYSDKAVAVKVYGSGTPSLSPSGNVNICQGESREIYATASGAVEIIWYVEKGWSYKEIFRADPATPFEVNYAGTFVAKAKYIIPENGKVCYSDYSQPVTTRIRALPLEPRFHVVEDTYYSGNPVAVEIDSRFKCPRFTRTCEERDYTYSFNWGDGSVVEELEPIERGMNSYEFSNISHVYQEAGDYTLTFSAENEYGCIASITASISIAPILCTAVLPAAAGESSRALLKNAYTGFYGLENNCFGYYTLDCISEVPAENVPNLVVKATAITLSDTSGFVPYPSAIPTQANDFESGRKGRWHVQDNYVYSTALLPNTINRESGLFNYIPFNWQKITDLDDRGNWLRASTVTRYSPDGNPLEEKNAIDLNSIARFGYYQAVPVTLAQNASYGSVVFESFELNYASSGSPVFEEGYQPGVSWVQHQAHSGKSSVFLNGQSLDLPKVYPIKGQKKMRVSLWFKSSQYLSHEEVLAAFAFQLYIPGGAVRSVKEKLKARVGDWNLLEGEIEYEAIDLTYPISVKLQNQQALQIWVDDVRIQPADALVTAYVYDPLSLRLITTFDDQHFGIYNQYDEEGRLTRKLIETERGIKTLQEQYTNVPVEPKSNP